MKSERSVILLEFNELTPTLIEQFSREGHLPNFKRFYDESLVYTTDAEESGTNLNPWVQWVTVHTGLSLADHGVHKLGEGHLLKKKRIWDYASDAGQRVWICGSMNVGYQDNLNGFVLPDPWSAGTEPYPASLSPYYAFVRQNVQEHTNEDQTAGLTQNLRFLRFMLGHGLSLGTGVTIARQIAGERMGTRGHWKRVAILDRLQWDVFRWYFRKHRPQFSTFFLNSTAHLQHKHWRNMQPEPFTIRPTDEEQAEYADAVLYGYREMDKILGNALDLAGADTTLILCTALSQQACTVYDEGGGKSFYRPKDFGKLLALAGVTGEGTVSPVMSEEFHVQFSNEDDAKDAQSRLLALKIGEEEVMAAVRKGADVLCGCQVHRQVPAGTIVRSEMSGNEASFEEIFYAAGGIKSGMHHPHGVLWIRTPERLHAVREDEVPLLQVAPTILELLELPAGADMASPLSTRVETGNGTEIRGAA